MITNNNKEDFLLRLKKIEGQMRGLQKMVEEKRYCIDIINQISAVRSALNQVGLLIMKQHVESCVSESIKAGRSQEKIRELMETVNRFIR